MVCNCAQRYGAQLHTMVRNCAQRYGAQLHTMVRNCAQRYGAQLRTMPEGNEFLPVPTWQPAKPSPWGSRGIAAERLQRWRAHGFPFGRSGSGQQSVTGVSAVDDSNSYWRIRGKTSTVCGRGTPVKCGQSIRLTHINTGRNLHSHHFTSPLSGNQEVSAFGEDGEGDYLDDWTVVCSGPYWARDSEVRFKHSSTDVFLSVTGEQYGRPIHGQKEVHGMSYSNQNNYWKVMEGIFMKPSELLRMDPYHSEL
ncbi:stromal cell-derived factor 2 [Alligator sinensis]|uniref:Stromal cell-derived factor 2 n=1 Tax=Alligator sinensis TaxID=38654 RepID=A0A1U7S827_ALLSI|nr:stromal cell-derived factor 2 [Alligator sinensis]